MLLLCVHLCITAESFFGKPPISFVFIRDSEVRRRRGMEDNGATQLLWRLEDYSIHRVVGQERH